MTEAPKPSMKLERKPKAKSAGPAKTTEARIAAISAGESKPKSESADIELETKPTMFRLSGRTRNLLELAKRDAERREGRKHTLTSRVEDAIIATYGHLEEKD